jgi:hypothetical protein
MEQNRNKRYSDEGRWDQEQDRNRRQSERWQEDDNDQWGNAGSLGSYGREQSGSGYGSTYGNQGYKQGNQKRWQEDDRMQNRSGGEQERGGYGNTGATAVMEMIMIADMSRDAVAARISIELWTKIIDDMNRNRDYDQGNMNREVQAALVYFGGSNQKRLEQ